MRKGRPFLAVSCGDVLDNGAASPLSPVVTASTGSSSDLSGATQVYWTRFLQLGLFCLYSMSNAFQWIEYSIVGNLVSAYYGVDPETVDFTAVVYMVTYIPLIFPAAWLLDKRGLRFVVLLGALGTCAGSWIKVRRGPFFGCLTVRCLRGDRWTKRFSVFSCDGGA